MDDITKPTKYLDLDALVNRLRQVQHLNENVVSVYAGIDNDWDFTSAPLYEHGVFKTGAHISTMRDDMNPKAIIKVYDGPVEEFTQTTTDFTSKSLIDFINGSVDELQNVYNKVQVFDEPIKNISKLCYGEMLSDMMYDVHWHLDGKYQFYSYTCLEDMKNKTAFVEGDDIMFDKDCVSHQYKRGEIVKATINVARRFLNLKNRKEYFREDVVYKMPVSLWNNKYDRYDNFSAELSLD